MASLTRRYRESIRTIVADVQGTNVLEPKEEFFGDDIDRNVSVAMAESLGYDEGSDA